MAYVNTGVKRSLTFTVTKKIGGTVQVGYPRSYDGRLSFPGYSAITDDQAKKLTDTEFNTRLSAFHSYVNSIEAGLDVDNDATNDAVVTDESACPPPPTTTTTTAAPTTTTTTA